MLECDTIRPPQGSRSAHTTALPDGGFTFQYRTGEWCVVSKDSQYRWASGPYHYWVRGLDETDRPGLHATEQDAIDAYHESERTIGRTRYWASKVRGII